MVKPPFIAPSESAARAKEQREIRDWHTLVAKLASEAETLHSWTQRPPEDELGEKINGITVTIPNKAGVDGRLFGSVTNHDIADALVKQGFAVEKAMVRLPTGPLKAIGESTVEVALHADVVVQVNVTIVPEA